jgi:hypothetical protein
MVACTGVVEEAAAAAGALGDIFGGASAFFVGIVGLRDFFGEGLGIDGVAGVVDFGIARGASLIAGLIKFSVFGSGGIVVCGADNTFTASRIGLEAGVVPISSSPKSKSSFQASSPSPSSSVILVAVEVVAAVGVLVAVAVCVGELNIDGSVPVIGVVVVFPSESTPTASFSLLSMSAAMALAFSAQLLHMVAD